MAEVRTCWRCGSTDARVDVVYPCGNKGEPCVRQSCELEAYLVGGEWWNLRCEKSGRLFEGAFAVELGEEGLKEAVFRKDTLATARTLSALGAAYGRLRAHEKQRDLQVRVHVQRGPGVSGARSLQPRGPLLFCRGRAG